MAIVNGCCCWRNLRSGSFASGFYILILYTIVLTAGVFQHFFNPEEDISAPIKRTLVFTIVMIVFSVGCIITSVLLLIGLCVDSRMLLIPWLICVFSATLLDGLGAVYIIIESKFSEYLLMLFVFDVIILGLNVYCLLCVYAQYKEYCAGRGLPQVHGTRPLPPLEVGRELTHFSRNVDKANKSAATNSSSVSVGQSSAFVIQNDIVSAEESSVQHRNLEDINFIEDKLSSSHLSQSPESYKVQSSSQDNIVCTTEESRCEKSLEKAPSKQD